MHTNLATREAPALPGTGRNYEPAAAPQPILQIVCRRAPLADPLALFSEAPACHFYTRIPTENLEMIGFGKAWSFETDGPDRFEAAQATLQAVFSTARSNGAEFGLSPRAWGGFSFHAGVQTGEWSGFAAASWFIPAYQFIRRGDEAFEIFTTALPSPSAHAPSPLPPRAAVFLAANSGEPAPAAWHADPSNAQHWRAQSDEALRALDENQWKKLVLARAQTYHYESGPTADFLDSLRTRHPGPVFAMRNGERWFVSATPEILLRARSGQFSTHAVAGTTKRGANAQEDNTLASGLLNSAKDRDEHAWVVQSILDALTPLSAEIGTPSTPLVMRLPKLQHLVSPISGLFNKGVTFLDAVQALHPTAAVGGFPREEASQWLLAHEKLSRGWYAAPIGWLDAEGDGSMWVAIRSGLLGPTQSILFAGAGLVRGSDSQAEWDETELKLHSFVTALGALGALGASETAGVPDPRGVAP